MRALPPRCRGPRALRDGGTDLGQVPWDRADRIRLSDGRLGRPPSLVGVPVAWDDRILQQRVREAGGRWVRARRLWVFPLSAAKRSELGDRLVPVGDQPETIPKVYHGKPPEKPHEKPTGINGEGSGGLS